MEETYLPAFEACVKEGKVEAVMGAYNRTNGEPCCASEELMNHYLRGKWKFQGHYVSDCWAIRDFHENHKVTDRPEESVKKALEAGCDLNCGCTYEKILNAYREGIIDENISQNPVFVCLLQDFYLECLMKQNMIKSLIWKWKAKNIWNLQNRRLLRVWYC